MNKIRIQNKLIGEGEPTFIIAEAGVNHNGDVELAKKMVDVAKEAGADVVKFQTFSAEKLVTKDASMASYQSKNTGIEQSQQEMLKKLELNYEDFDELKKYCDKKEIIFLSTPHTEDAADYLDRLLPAFKIGSGDLTNIPYLEKIAKKGKAMILGTGMGTLDEVQYAVNTVRSQGNDKIIILHCTTNYPCPYEEVNLKVINTLKQKVSNCAIGYSDHTLGILASLAAVAMGAAVIEKHFTVDKSLPGPDHRSSIDSDELSQLVSSIRRLETLFGSSDKKPTKSEQKIMKLVRKSIIATMDVPKDTVLTEEMLTIKRPGTGIQPKDVNKIIGKKTKSFIRKDQVINFEDIQ